MVWSASAGRCRLLGRLGACALCLVSLVAAAAPRCTFTYRPDFDETAFVPVGAALKVADRHCLHNYLILDQDYDAGPVILRAGAYRQVGAEEGRSFFSLKNSEGQFIESCKLCDPIERLFVWEAEPHALCVLSALGISACTVPGSIPFTIETRENVTDNACTPALKYYGRDGAILRFAVDDCRTTTKPALFYDLALGNTIRFLEERYEIITADNEGLSYKRLQPVPLNQRAVPEPPPAEPASPSAPNGNP